MSIPTLSPTERAYIRSGLSHPTSPSRLDNRSLQSFRSLQISQGDAPQANGSARVVLGGKGGTEVVVGIRLEVVDAGEVGEEVDEERVGKESWRGSIEVDVTPQAYPHLQSQNLNSLASYYANLISDHFIPYLPALPILPPFKYFQPQIHATILSSSTGSVPFILTTAVRAAFCDLHVPQTRFVGYEAASSSTSTSKPVDPTIAPESSAAAAGRDGIEDAGLDAGLSGAVRAKKAGGVAKKAGGRRGERKMVVTGKGRAEYVARPGDDWDLEDLGGGEEGDGELMDVSVRRGLPVLVTLHMIPETDRYFLDASREEELACPSRIHLFFSSGSGSTPSGKKNKLKICGLRIEGGEGVDMAKLPALLLDGRRLAGTMAEEMNGIMNAS